MSGYFWVLDAFSSDCEGMHIMQERGMPTGPQDWYVNHLIWCEWFVCKFRVWKTWWDGAVWPQGIMCCACALSVSVESAITGWCVFMWVSSLEAVDQVFHSNQRNTEESHGPLSSSRTLSTLPEHFTITTPHWTAAACEVHLKKILMFISLRVPSRRHQSNKISTLLRRGLTSQNKG